MCTAIALKNGGLYFGRTLDLSYSYAEAVTVAPRHFPFPFRRAGSMAAHYALIGVATVADGYPLYYDAANERGLCMAGLHFPGYAVYTPETDDPAQTNVAPFELIPWILGRCASVREARALLSRTHIAPIPFSAAYPLTPLHWLIADADGAIAVEPTATGLHVYDDPAGVLTNLPPFPMQMFALQPYRALSPEPAVPQFGTSLPWEEYSRGTGSLGLPGDFTSPARFVRAVFAAHCSAIGETEEARVGQFFHLTDLVQIPRGCVKTEDGSAVITVYTSCYSAAEKRFYYTTYEDRQIACVPLAEHDLDEKTLSSAPLSRTAHIRYPLP